MTIGVRCGRHEAAEAQHVAAQRERYDEQRGNATDRGYDHDWRRVRAEYLRDHPACEARLPSGRCCAAPGYDVDHVVELRDGGARLDPQNLRTLCRSHHVTKTARARRERESRRLVGP